MNQLDLFSTASSGKHYIKPVLALFIACLGGLCLPGLAQAQYTPGGLGDTDLIGWFIADSVSTDGSGNVETWYNQGSEGNATQSTASLRPELVSNGSANGSFPVVRFNGSKWIQTAAFASVFGQPNTTIINFKEATTGQNQHVIAGGNNIHSLGSNNSLGVNAGSDGFVSATINQWKSTAFLANGSSSRISNSEDDNTTGGFGSNGISRITFGSDINGTTGSFFGGFIPLSRFNGDIGEAIVYSRSLNRTQINILHNYLDAKWGGLIGSETQLFNPPAGFTNELIGIGRDNNEASAVTSTQSSTGGITISSTTSEFLSEVGRYLLAAHDGEPAEFLTVDAASNTRRVERAWYVQKTSNEDEITSDGEVSINVNFDEVPDIRPTILSNDAFYVVYNENDPTFPAATNQILPISSFTTNTSGTTITDITITADAIYIHDGYYALFAQPYDPTDPDDPTNGDVSIITSNETTIGAGTVEMVGNYPGVRVQGNSTLVLVPDNENLRILDNFVVEGGAGLHIKPGAEFSTPTGTRITLEPGARYLNEGGHGSISHHAAGNRRRHGRYPRLASALFPLS